MIFVIGFNLKKPLPRESLFAGQRHPLAASY